jgi:hypothetical protein
MTDYIKRADAIAYIDRIINSGLGRNKSLEYIHKYISSLPSAEAEQVTSKLKKPCDSLLTDDSAECKEQKSKLEHDREWIIGCIKHDGFIKTHRFDKANQIILDALEKQSVVRCKDCKWQEECSQLITLHKFSGVYQEISFCSHGERREPIELPQYAEWKEPFEKMAESAKVGDDNEKDED